MSACSPTRCPGYVELIYGAWYRLIGETCSKIHCEVAPSFPAGVSRVCYGRQHMVFVCDFLCVFAKFVQKILNLSQKLGKSHTKPSAGDARLNWMLPCSNHINFCSIKEVLHKLCKIFEKSHEKSQEYNHVLAPIVGKDWGQKFLLVFVVGVQEGLINRGSFWFSIFTPSSVQCIVQCNVVDYGE